jgi:CheY-like chemotaxis protein
VRTDDAGRFPLDNDEMAPARVLVVDDHEGFRATARALLESDGLLVVAEAADGAEAVAATRRVVPDLVLLDVHLPDLDGFEVSELVARLPYPPVVVLTSSRPVADLRRRLQHSAAAGFVPKHLLSGAALEELANGISS